MKEHFVRRIMENPAFASGSGDGSEGGGEGGGGGLGEEGARRMTSAREENMVASLKMLRSRFGGAEGYIKGVCGLGEEEIGALRRNLVVSRRNEGGPEKGEERLGSAL